RVARQRRPARIAILFVRFLETRRRRDRAIIGALAPNMITHRVQRLQHFLSKLRALFEDLFHHIHRRIRKCRQIGVAIQLQHLAQEKLVFAYGCGIGGHERLRRGNWEWGIGNGPAWAPFPTPYSLFPIRFNARLRDASWLPLRKPALRPSPPAPPDE